MVLVASVVLSYTDWYLTIQLLLYFLCHGHACESSPNPCQCQKKQITLSQHWRWSQLKHLNCTDSARKQGMVTPPNNHSVDFTRPTQFHTNWESLRSRGDKLKCQFFPGTDKNTSVFHSSQLHQIVFIYLQREALMNTQWLFWYARKRTLILKKYLFAKTSSTSAQPVSTARGQPSTQGLFISFQGAWAQKQSEHRNGFCHQCKHSVNGFTQWSVLHHKEWQNLRKLVAMHPSLLPTTDVTSIWIFNGL